MHGIRTRLIILKNNQKYCFTWYQVGYTTCKGHPGIGKFWSTYFSAFHPYECEDTSEEAGDNGADSKGSASVQEHWKERA